MWAEGHLLLLFRLPGHCPRCSASGRHVALGKASKLSSQHSQLCPGRAWMAKEGSCDSCIMWLVWPGLCDPRPVLKLRMREGLIMRPRRRRNTLHTEKALLETSRHKVGGKKLNDLYNKKNLVGNLSSPPLPSSPFPSPPLPSPFLSSPLSFPSKFVFFILQWDN